VLDASSLEYISSAGLRVILRLKKAYPDITVYNVSSEIYDIFEMTGFTEMMNVEKAYRVVSIEGCEEIGRGANGTIYRIDKDNVVKVYNNADALEDIKHEREVAKLALILGTPTAISYDVVKVGNSYGSVFELLNATSASEYIAESPDHLEWFIEQSVRLMKQVHGIEVEPGEFPDMKQQTYAWLEKIRPQFSAAHYETIRRILDSVPDRHTLLHADFHLKNIMICGDELMLIDMETLCTGDPVFELATVYNSYREFPSIDPAAAQFLGIDVETAARICDRTFELYTASSSVPEVMNTARLLGGIRIIDFMGRHAEHPASSHVIECCLRDMKMLLEQMKG
jgi:uncharacterized protein (TIGR02172 family)